MISPLLGPSTVIHIFIVFIGSTINFTKKTYKELGRLTNEINRAKILSTIIMLLILLFILGCSYYAVTLGLMSDKSNVNIIEKLFSSSSTGILLNTIIKK